MRRFALFQVAGHGIPLLDILMGHRDGDALLQAILGAYGASREARGTLLEIVTLLIPMVTKKVGFLW